MNKVQQPEGEGTAESVERRPVAKGNPGETTAGGTQRSKAASSALERIRAAARRNARQQFTNLFSHIDVALLRRSYSALRHDAAPGADALTWEDYGQKLEERLTDVHDRLHTGRYRAQPSKRQWIAKAGGGQRPIGIASVEDKIVQKAMVLILQEIYEEDFQGCSYGFRPERSPHNALDALYVAITQRKVNWVLDADIRSFFDTLDHWWVLKFLEHRVADPRMLRLVRKFLRAGVSEAGQWSKTEVGTPQGAVLSPLLANIYLHYVLDVWMRRWRRREARGEVYLVRYADDFVMGFQHRADADRFVEALRARLAKFSLELHAGKTRLIEFGRFAASNRARRGEGKPETFDFLGFTHYCTCRRSDGGFALGRKTIARRLRKKYQAIGQRLKRIRHRPITEQGHWLGSVVRGHIGFYGVPGNTRALRAFRTEISRMWLRALRRRSQKGRGLRWEKFRVIVERWLPPIRVVHPYPNQRLCVRPKAGAV